MTTSATELAHLLADAKRADEELADAQAHVSAARERATQAWARYKQAADKLQPALPLEEA